MGVGNAAVTTAGAMSLSLAKSMACTASVMTFPALATRAFCVQVSDVEYLLNISAFKNPAFVKDVKYCVVNV